MTLAKIILALLVTAWVLLGIATAIPKHEQALGTGHPEHSTMRQGGSGIERHARLHRVGWALAVVQHLIFVGMLCFGLRKRDRLSRLTKPLVCGVVFEIAVVSGIFLTYHRFLHDARPTFLGPFPTPTALMLLGLWSVPFYYVVIYVVAFPRYVWTPEDAERFQHLLKTREASTENAD